MSVTFHPDQVDAGPNTFYWALFQPADPGAGDTELVLGEIFHDWDPTELQPVLHSIARKLQYVASKLLSQPLEVPA